MIRCLKITLALALLLGGSLRGDARTNVLFIILDDQNTWVEPMGEYPQVKTPALNRLAQGGVTFTRAYCQAPICAPSRVSFLGGLRPSTTGLYSLNSTLYNHPTSGTANHKVMHRYFNEAGYTTATVGKVFHNEAELNAIAGYIDYRGAGTDYGGKPAPKLVTSPVSGNNSLVDWGVYPASDEQTPDYQSVTWATNRMAGFAASPATPFFMTVGLVRPHVPLYAPQKWYDLYPPNSFALPFYSADDLADTPRFARYLHWALPEPRTESLLAYDEWTNHTRAYLACVSFVDAQIGRLLDGLTNHQLADETIVVVVSDNGYHLGEKGLTAKTTLWDRATRVPLLISAPGVAGAQRCAQPVELLDVYPTLLDLCGLPAYARLEGISLRPLLENPTNAPIRRPAISTHGSNNHGVADARYRYIRYADGTEEMYDRFVDPNEQVNRINHPNFREAAHNLAAWLPTNNAANLNGSGSGSRLAEIGTDKIVRWEGNPIYDPEVPGFVGGRLDGAAWIWSYYSTSIPGGANAGFRRTFAVADPGDISAAILTASADNILEVWINGIKVSYDDTWRTLVITNLAQYLQAGPNVLAVKASNFAGTASAAGFICSLEIQLTNGPGEYIVTTNTVWKSVSAVSGSGWTTNGFNDSAWGSPAIIAVYDTGPWMGQTGGGTPARRDTNAIPVTTEGFADGDGDLLPDWWEKYYTGATNVLLGLNTSYDGDPASDVQEYRMGTSPTNAASYLRLVVQPLTGGAFELTHSAEPGRDYRLFSSDDLVFWSPVTGWRYGNGRVLTNSLPPPTGSSGKAFFRVEVRQP